MGGILVVDENQTVERLRKRLGALGHKVSAAGDAYSGLGAAIREHPDLIVVGSNLPGGGGLTMLERLRGNVSFASTPVVILGDEAAVPGDPRVRFLPSLAEPGALEAVVAEFLPSPQAPDEPSASGPDGSGASVPPKRPSMMGNGDLPDEDLPPGEILEL